MKEVKYGPLNPDMLKSIVMPMTAAEVVKARSGRFVTLNTSTGAVEIADAGDTLLFGFAEAAETASSASGLKVLVYPAQGSHGVFRLPIITGTLTAAMFGKTCDLVRSSNIQGVDLTASGEDVVTIVGGDVEGNEYADVMFTAAKVTATQGVV